MKILTRDSVEHLPDRLFPSKLVEMRDNDFKIVVSNSGLLACWRRFCSQMKSTNGTEPSG